MGDYCICKPSSLDVYDNICGICLLPLPEALPPAPVLDGEGKQ